MLFFKTNKERTKQCDCGHYLQFAHSVKTLTGGSAGKGKIKP